MSEDERCGRCDRSAIDADDLDNWIANEEGALICRAVKRSKNE